MTKTAKLFQAMNNSTLTANGAPSHKSTLNPVLDLFSLGGAMRGQDISSKFEAAYLEDALLALKCAFYLRDIRGSGQGERESFRQILRWLYTNARHDFHTILPLVPFYGRWDDILEFVNDPIVAEFVRDTLFSDMNSKHPSLLAKWMPSENASSKHTRKLARQWVAALEVTVTKYRKLLSYLRNKIDIVESRMSSQEWKTIQYEKVPSRASMIYRKAFQKHDPEGYQKYLEQVQSGEKKINAAVLYPYEIYKEYHKESIWKLQPTLEELWKALPNYITDNKSFIVMADVSGSMSGDPMAVSVSLAIYAAERSKGPFSGHYISYSEVPLLVKVKGKTLADKLRSVQTSNVGYNTNIQAAFDLILNTAITHKLKQEDLPEMIFVISDMQFDDPQHGPKTNFQVVDGKFNKAGYKRPTLVFWNVRSYGDVPVTEREEGVYLVSGLSATTFKNALNCKASTPYDMMLEVLNSERYAKVDEVLGL